MASQAASTQSAESDPAWEYNNLEEDDSITCHFCNLVTRGGISGARQHQIRACLYCPKVVKDRLKAFTEKEKSKKGVVADQRRFGEDDEGGEDVKIPRLEKKRSGVQLSGQEKRLKSNVMDEACDKELIAKTAIARFFYQAGIAFNVVRLDCFKEMIELIGNYGPNLKPPSYYELRGPFLKKEVDDMNQWIEGHKEKWSKYGCSIMLDSYTDREQKTLINILVNSSNGTVFMESVNASSNTMSGSEMYALVEKFVDQIGETNVVQVITNTECNSVRAGKMLMAIRPNLFWTPCAAHCIDLMLEDIGNISKVKKTIRRGIFLVGYIYNRRGVLNMMREFTKNKELTRNGITRSATTYLSLLSLYKQKACLTEMFTSEKWTKSVWAKEAKGKTAKKLVSMPLFWNNVVWTLKVMAPIIRALRLVKNEKKPAMGYIYKALDTAKEAIRSAFDKDDDCKVVYDIIDKRWACQLHHPLHAAGYYFNPEFYCTNPNIEKDSEVMKGLLACVQKLAPSNAKQDLIMTELIKWVNQAGHFSNDLAVRARGKIAPADWWKLYGKEIPNVQELAVKVLSLACSSSCCERNLSAFEHINSKKVNELVHERLQDVTFVKHNLTLKNRRTKDVRDPISVADVDYGNEWLTGKMEEDRALENKDATRVNVTNAGLEDDEEEEEIDEEEFPSVDIDHEFLEDWVADYDSNEDEDEDEDDYDDDEDDYI